MTPRIDPAAVAPDAYRAMAQLERYVRGSGLEPKLIHLVKLRASYINGCSYCVDMHTKEARHDGETEQRLYAIPVWHETPFFTERERAAMLWTETVTNVSQTNVPDDVYAQVRTQFSETELVNLTMAVVAINGWNRIAISFRSVPGSHVVSARTPATASS